jgi:Omp85 superfamily domain
MQNLKSHLLELRYLNIKMSKQRLSIGGLLLAHLFFWTNLNAQKTPFWKKLHPDSLVNKKLTYLPMPSISYLPETGLRLGLTVDYFFNTQKEEDSISITRNSFAYVQAVYSTKKQLTLEGFWQIYTPNERYFLRGTAGYTDFSEYFWGTGNVTLPEKSKADVSYGRYFVQSKVVRKLKDKVFAGVSLNVSDTRNIRFDAPVRSDEIGKISETKHSLVIGLGPNVLLDFRNNPFSPTQGWYGEAFWHHYSPNLGNQTAFDEVYVDVRKYFPFGGKKVLGFQWIGHFTEGGNIPWRELPRMGGSYMMRGYVSGRYRDNQLWSAQSEYRFPINRFLVGAVFTGVGGVAPTIDAFRLADTRLTYGGGIRALINKKKEVYFRADYAFNNNGTSGFYLRAFDAF